MPAKRFTFESKGIGELLREGRLLVPPNQRSYAWEERHIDDLLHDLTEAIENDVEEYFLGTIVLIESEEASPSIADGQQRLATISVLLARIRDELSHLGRVASAAKVDGDFIRSIEMDTEERLPRLSMNQEDNEYFKRCVISSPTDEDFDADAATTNAVRASNKRLLNASELLRKHVASLVADKKPELKPAVLNRWVKFLETKTAIIVVRVSDEIGAYRIFETLNDRGLRASQADILKNYFFSKSGSRLGEAQKFWNTFASSVESLGGDENDRLVTFLRHLWIISHGPTKDRELAAQIKAEIAGETKTLKFLNEANIAVQDYVALWSSHNSKWVKIQCFCPSVS